MLDSALEIYKFAFNSKPFYLIFHYAKDKEPYSIFLLFLLSCVLFEFYIYFVYLFLYFI